MRLSRPCYDKYHRCPGWAGPGTRYTDNVTCKGGYVHVDYNDTLWRWRFHRCDTCDIVVLPYVTRWLDPGWWRWKIALYL